MVVPDLRIDFDKFKKEPYELNPFAYQDPLLATKLSMTNQYHNLLPQNAKALSEW